jgi:hypothetical protein
MESEESVLASLIKSLQPFNYIRLYIVAIQDELIALNKN